MQVQPLCTLPSTARRLFYVWIWVQEPFFKNITISLSPHKEHWTISSFPKYFALNISPGSKMVMWLLSKVLSIWPMGQGPSWEGDDIPQKTMEIFWGKIVPILKGSYWRGQVESRIRRESLCTYNNREADGSDPEQLEQSCPFAYPKFTALSLDLLLYFYVSHLRSGVRLGTGRRVFRHGIWSRKNPPREALIPPSPLALCLVSPGKHAACTSKISPVGSTPRMSVWGSTTTACLRA